MAKQTSKIAWQQTTPLFIGRLTDAGSLALFFVCEECATESAEP
jgi:hypothetical protein